MAAAQSDDRFGDVRAAVDRIAAQDAAEVLSEARAEARSLVRALLVNALAESMIDALGPTRTPTDPTRTPTDPTRTPTEPTKTPAEPTQAPTETTRAPTTPTRPAARVVESSAAEPRDRSPHPDPEPRREPSAENGLSGHGLYIYCVVPAQTALPANLPGIDPLGSPTLLRHGRLAAVVSPVPLEDFEENRLREHLADMEWVERTARAHEHVLDLVAQRATLIPMRMCSIYRNETGVREMLSREDGALQNALARLEGKAEWGVKVFALPPSSDGADDGDEDQPVSGTDYMRRRQTEREERWRVADELHDACALIHERLSEMTADALTVPVQRPEVSGHSGQMLLNGVYLVEIGEEAGFHEAVESMQAEYAPLGLELVPTGPWPAYNFVPGTIGAAW